MGNATSSSTSRRYRPNAAFASFVMVMLVAGGTVVAAAARRPASAAAASRVIAGGSGGGGGGRYRAALSFASASGGEAAVRRVVAARVVPAAAAAAFAGGGCGGAATFASYSHSSASLLLRSGFGAACWRCRPSASSSSRLRLRQFSAGGDSDATAPSAGGGESSSSSSSTSRTAQQPLVHTFSSLTESYALPSDCVVGLANDVLTDLRPGRRIVSFGDVHGDLDALKAFLVTAGVMDSTSTLQDPVWCGGDDICVQVGDILDRGDDELGCLRVLTSLARQAHDAGGALVMLYGNHESLNCAGLFQYANAGGNVEHECEVGVKVDEGLGSDRWRLQFAGNEPSRWAMYEPGGLLARTMLSNMKIAVVVGRTVFVHAGLTADHLRRYGGIEGMNRQVREWILNAKHGEDNPHGTYRTVEEVIRSAEKRARTISGLMPECLGGGIGAPSPVWMRDYSQPSDMPPKNPDAQSMLDETLEEIGRRIVASSNDGQEDAMLAEVAAGKKGGRGGTVAVERMVMGHTPQRRINAALNGKAIRVDVGASRGVMGGTPEVLEIVHHGGDGEEEDEVHVLTVDGRRIPMEERTILEGSYIEQLI